MQGTITVSFGLRIFGLMKLNIGKRSNWRVNKFNIFENALKSYTIPGGKAAGA
jgi:hypothetical protein